MRTMPNMRNEEASISRGSSNFARATRSVSRQCQCGALPLSYAPLREHYTTAPETVAPAARLVAIRRRMARVQPVRERQGELNVAGILEYRRDVYHGDDHCAYRDRRSRSAAAR